MENFCVFCDTVKAVASGSKVDACGRCRVMLCYPCRTVRTDDSSLEACPGCQPERFLKKKGTRAAQAWPNHLAWWKAKTKNEKQEYIQEKTKKDAAEKIKKKEQKEKKATAEKKEKNATAEKKEKKQNNGCLCT
jgi:hypothetical protein